VAASPGTAPGRELYGFLPYWEMDDGIADHLAGTPLTTLGLFSVTHTRKGALNTGQRGYRTITGDLGARLIREAHARGTAVQLVYTSFGAAKNTRLFEDAQLQVDVINELVALVGDLGVDGINVDVEGLDPALVPAYGAFVGNLRKALVARQPSGQVSVATGASGLGAAMAAAATAAGADRMFLMGYDYRTGRSEPGASAPIDRRDGPGKASLQRSLDLYAALGVPADRTLLGLPLYGVEWPVAGPVIGAPQTGKGAAWILRKHADVLGDTSLVPLRDDVEAVEVYLFASDGSVGPPSPDPSASPGASGDRTWRAVYVDSPATLERKLALANDRGLAGAGFWAIGYERGLPGYTSVMQEFTGQVRGE
jgi:spore germination protein YaaH